jgi:hypothetical protein
MKTKLLISSIFAALVSGVGIAATQRVDGGRNDQNATLRPWSLGGIMRAKRATQEQIVCVLPS